MHGIVHLMDMHYLIISAEVSSLQLIDLGQFLRLIKSYQRF